MNSSRIQSDQIWRNEKLNRRTEPSFLFIFDPVKIRRRIRSLVSLRKSKEIELLTFNSLVLFFLETENNFSRGRWNLRQKKLPRRIAKVDAKRNFNVFPSWTAQQNYFVCFSSLICCSRLISWNPRKRSWSWRSLRFEDEKNITFERCAKINRKKRPIPKEKWLDVLVKVVFLILRQNSSTDCLFS